MIGSIPGLTAVMGVALLVPITFCMEPVSAIASLAATAIFAGDVPGALMRIPGAPASAACVEDAHAMSGAGPGAHWGCRWWPPLSAGCWA